MSPQKKFNPFPNPKKGVRRMIQKRPSSQKSASWNKIDYVKDKKEGGHVRREQVKWRRTIQELMSASDTGIVEMLITDGLLPNWKGAVCPHCECGTLGGLTSNGQDHIPRYRCNSRECQRYFPPQHLHPFFSATEGPEGHSLQMQAAALMLRLLNVPLASIHVLTRINHKALERMNRSLLLTRKGYVQERRRRFVLEGVLVRAKRWKRTRLLSTRRPSLLKGPRSMTARL